MWYSIETFRRLPGPRALLLGAGLLASLFASPQLSYAQDDPVDDLQQALAIRLEDLTNPTDSVLTFRRENLKKKISRLHTLGQLRRALALEEWKPIDVGTRKEVADRFINGIQKVIKTGDVTARMAAANLIAEIGPTIRSVDPAERAGFARSLTKQVVELTKDPDQDVQQEALRALGNINPLPKDAFNVLKSSLEHDQLGSRRQAASALGQLVRVVGFLQKRGRTAAGIESTRPEVIEVAQAAAAGASYGLADKDAQVRRFCLEAIDESARASADMIQDPFQRKEFPPEGRPLSDEERKDLQGPLGPNATVMRELKELEGIFKAYQREMPLLARNLLSGDTRVATEAARALEDVAIARIRLFRRALSAPAVTKAEEETRRNEMKSIDPLAYFFTDSHLDDVVGLTRASLPQLRRSAVYILELMGNEARPALPALAQALNDTDRNVLWSAARAIGNIGPRQAPFAVPGLAKLLIHIDDNLRFQASATLEAMGPEARAAMPEIIKAITTWDSETRVAAMGILVTIGVAHDRPAIPALIESLGASDKRVRAAAAETLGKLAPIASDAVPALRHALEDEDQDVRMNASEALLAILTPPID
jgi:HEAT repeat protein